MWGRGIRLICIWSVWHWIEGICNELMDWSRIGMDWQRSDVGLTLDWHRIDNGLVTDWQRIGRGLMLDWHLMVDGLVGPIRPPSRHFGGFPFSTLVPCLLTELASDWYRIGAICANACRTCVGPFFDGWSKRLTIDRYHIYQFVEAMDRWIGTGLTLDWQIGDGLASHGNWMSWQ